MATFKTVALRQRADGFWNVSIRVTHNRKSRYLKTDKIVETKSVNKKNHEVKDPFVLEACTVKIAHFAEMLNKQPIRTWSVDDVVAYLESGTADVCFSDYARQYHANLYNNGQERNARNYELAYRHFSFRQMMKGSIFYRGRKVSEFTDVGFNNVDEIIGKLMKELPSTIPSRAMVLIKIENVDKGQTQTYSRMVE